MRRQRRKRVEVLKVGGVIPSDMPRCCTCGKPLLRLPPSITSSAPTRVFQCAECFYPGTGYTAQRSGPVTSGAGWPFGDFSPDSSD